MEYSKEVIDFLKKELNQYSFGADITFRVDITSLPLFDKALKSKRIQRMLEERELSVKFVTSQQ